MALPARRPRAPTRSSPLRPRSRLVVPGVRAGAGRLRELSRATGPTGPRPAGRGPSRGRSPAACAGGGDRRGAGSTAAPEGRRGGDVDADSRRRTRTPRPTRGRRGRGERRARSAGLVGLLRGSGRRRVLGLVGLAGGRRRRGRPRSAPAWSAGWSPRWSASPPVSAALVPAAASASAMPTAGQRQHGDHGERPATAGLRRPGGRGRRHRRRRSRS